MDTTVRLPKALEAWGTSEFSAVFKAEVEQLKPAALPLQKGVSRGSYVSGERFQVMVLGVSEAEEGIRVTAGIHFQSIIAGCSCADDPTPVDELSEYCELLIVIDKPSAAVRVALLAD